MSQLPKAFKGHDLTGWVLTSPNRVSRLAMDGERIAIVAYQPNPGVRFYRAFHAELSLGQDRDLGSLLFKIDDYIKGYGGWAPAPIGSDPGWQDIETAPKDGTWFLAAEQYEETPLIIRWSTARPSRIGYPRIPGFVGDTSNVTVHGDAYIGCDIDEQYLTHWHPLPAPPEAKP